MSRSLALLLLAVSAIGATGCATVYTSITKQADGSYLVTRNKAGFLSVQGSTLRCTEAGDHMVCKEVAGPE